MRSLSFQDFKAVPNIRNGRLSMARNTGIPVKRIVRTTLPSSICNPRRMKHLFRNALEQPPLSMRKYSSHRKRKEPCHCPSRCLARHALFPADSSFVSSNIAKVFKNDGPLFSSSVLSLCANHTCHSLSSPSTTFL